MRGLLVWITWLWKPWATERKSVGNVKKISCWAVSLLSVAKNTIPQSKWLSFKGKKWFGLKCLIQGQRTVMLTFLLVESWDRTEHDIVKGRQHMCTGDSWPQWLSLHDLSLTCASLLLWWLHAGSHAMFHNEQVSRKTSQQNLYHHMPVRGRNNSYHWWALEV